MSEINDVVRSSMTRVEPSVFLNFTATYVGGRTYKFVASVGTPKPFERFDWFVRKQYINTGQSVYYALHDEDDPETFNETVVLVYSHAYEGATTANVYRKFYAVKQDADPSGGIEPEPEEYQTRWYKLYETIAPTDPAFFDIGNWTYFGACFGQSLGVKLIEGSFTLCTGIRWKPLDKVTTLTTWDTGNSVERQEKFAWRYNKVLRSNFGSPPASSFKVFTKHLDINIINHDLTTSWYLYETVSYD